MAGSCEGGCACGKVRYRLTTAPMFVHCCHCTECQRASGAAFGVNAPIETDRITLLAGEPRPLAVPKASGRVETALSCPDCGTTLWLHHGLLGERIALVCVGTLDDAGAWPPQMHCFTRSKLPWVVLPADARTAEGNYDLDQIWPKESLERLAAAMR